MSGLPIRANEVVYFRIDSDGFFTDDDSSVDVGVFGNEIPHDDEGLVMLVGDGEEYFKIGVFLNESGFYVFV